MPQITEQDRAPLVLASGSPRRRELLERIGIAIDVRPADIDETAAQGEEAVAYARRLAERKARTVADAVPGRWVLGADTIVEIDGDILGKAERAEQAREMLARLAGMTHRVTTAFALAGPSHYLEVGHATTEVDIGPLSAVELADYVASEEWRGKAGAYAVQGMAAAMVTGVRGSITNVIGLPLSDVLSLLGRAGAASPRYTLGKPA